jgi:hypothetical protein
MRNTSIHQESFPFGEAEAKKKREKRTTQLLSAYRSSLKGNLDSKDGRGAEQRPDRQKPLPLKAQKQEGAQASADPNQDGQGAKDSLATAEANPAKPNSKFKIEFPFLIGGSGDAELCEAIQSKIEKVVGKSLDSVDIVDLFMDKKEIDEVLGHMELKTDFNIKGDILTIVRAEKDTTGEYYADHLPPKSDL